MSVVLLADAKTFLNFTTDDQDAELQSMLNRAEAIIARRVGPLEPVTVTDEVHTGPGPIVLKKYPVVSATSASTSGVDVSDLDLDADSGVLYGTFDRISRAVKVTYVAGWNPLPADLELAVLELVGHLWESQRGTTAVVPGALPGEDVTTPAGAYLLPYRVQSLIEPYVIPTVA